MKRYIHIQKADRDFIVKSLKVTERTVFNALSFDEVRGHTELACRIRKLAMDRGGIVMYVSSEMETLFDADGYMRQYFPNGALLEISKSGDGGASIWFRGEKVWSAPSARCSEIECMQERAAALR